MSWYIILTLVTVCAIFILALLSWIFGDFDIDLDGDADIDGDGSSILSFKGIVHFLFGFGGTLSMIAVLSSSDAIYKSYHFSWWQYLVATLFGILTMYLLYKLYKFVMKAEHGSNDNCISDGYDVVVLNHIAADVYDVMVYTPSGTKKVPARAKTDKPEIGVRNYYIRNEIFEETGQRYYAFYKK